MLTGDTPQVRERKTVTVIVWHLFDVKTHGTPFCSQQNSRGVYGCWQVDPSKIYQIHRLWSIAKSETNHFKIVLALDNAKSLCPFLTSHATYIRPCLTSSSRLRVRTVSDWSKSASTLPWLRRPHAGIRFLLTWTLDHLDFGLWSVRRFTHFSTYNLDILRFCSSALSVQHMGVSIHGGSQRFYDDDNCTPNDLGNLRMGVSVNGGTLSHYPFLDGIVPETNHPAIKLPPWKSPYHVHGKYLCIPLDPIVILIPFLSHSYSIHIPFLSRYVDIHRKILLISH